MPPIQDETRTRALDLWPELFGFALQLIRDRGRAEDLCQEAYLRLWSMPRELDEERPLRPLLFTILRNLVRDEARRGRAAPLDEMDAADAADDRLSSDEVEPPRAAERREEWGLVHQALQQMSPLWRGALYLADGLELSYAEIAKILDRSEDVIRVTLHRARARVRVLLHDPASRRSSP